MPPPPPPPSGPPVQGPPRPPPHFMGGQSGPDPYSGGEFQVILPSSTHYIKTTLFYNSSEISWFTAINFHDCDVDKLENRI